MSRRSLQALALAALIASVGAAARAQTSTSDLHSRAAPGGPIVESPRAMQVTTVIQCYCGTCVNQTLHECTCGLAAMERTKVAAAIEAGASPESLVAAYVAEHGPQIRIVPVREGLNLLGWAVPFAASLAGLVALMIVLRGWRLRSPALPRPIPAGTPMADDDERPYRDRLERDLREQGL